jgi:DAK2 domain fusion protein YloV
MDGNTVRAWARAALAALGRARAEIDALNVYPVPDADTGTNLYLTFESACAALDDRAASAGPARSLRALAHGAVRGARGNSGVILSQLLLGFAEAYATSAAPGAGTAYARALRHATELGYQAVATPVEGTVLTVANAAASAADVAAIHAADDLAAVARAAADTAVDALAVTPDQLPALRDAGVVDAGARGLVVLLDAIASLAAGADPADGASTPPATSSPSSTPAPDAAHDRVQAATGDPLVRGEVARSAGARTAPPIGATDQRPGYEVVFLLTADEPAADTLRAELDALRASGDADSLVVVGGNGLWRVHVHAVDPDPVLALALAAGRPSDLHVTYLNAAPHPRAATERGGRAVLAVAHGPGLAKLFAAAGAHVLPVGDAAGPVDTAELAAAIDATHAAEVIVLGNAPEVATAAQSAADQAARPEGGERRVAVVPSRTPVHGIAALAVHDPARRFDADVVAMTAAAGATRYGALIVATAEAWTSAGICHPGDVLGCVDGDVALIADRQADAAVAVLDRMLSAGGEMVTLVTGDGMAEDVPDALRQHVRTHRPDVDVHCYAGGQPQPALLIGLE